MRDLLGQHQARVVVAALAAVLLGLVEAEEAELAHAREDRVRERRLLPFLGVGGELFDREVADRLAQLFVLVGEDEVLAAGALKSGFRTLSAVAAMGTVSCSCSWSARRARRGSRHAAATLAQAPLKVNSRADLLPTRRGR